MLCLAYVQLSKKKEIKRRKERKKDKITPRVKNFVLNRHHGHGRSQTIFCLHFYLLIRMGCSVPLATGFSVTTKWAITQLSEDGLVGAHHSSGRQAFCRVSLWWPVKELPDPSSAVRAVFLLSVEFALCVEGTASPGREQRSYKSVRILWTAWRLGPVVLRWAVREG